MIDISTRSDGKAPLGLNEAQRAAVEHGAGPLLVVAGAGTGKTKTLAARVAALIQRGADPGRILLLTFTRRAAAEMLRRASSYVGEAATAKVWGGTFHAMANRILRMHAARLGLNQSFTVMDQGDAQDLMHLIRTDFELQKSQQRFPQKGTMLAIYSRCLNTAGRLEDVLATHFPWCAGHELELKRVFQEYGDRKAHRHLLDYDDLLLYWDQALDHPQAGPDIAGRFQHVLVDEYQDTNAVQAGILGKLWTAVPGPADASAQVGGSDRSLMVVGDDAQSIYRFRGATIDNILRFPEDFPGATKVTLEENYRSVTPILELSNRVMASAKRRFTKNLWSQRPGSRKPLLVTCADELAQCRYVVEQILEQREAGVALTKQAVLFRATHNSDALEVELSRRNIPFVKWGGLRFLEAAHIKDLLAFLRILENPRDDLSWMRVLQMLEGIGPQRAREVVHGLEARGGDLEALRMWRPPEAASAHFAELTALLEDLQGAGDQMPLPVQIQRIRKFYTPIFERLYDNPEMRLRDLDQLELLAQRENSRATFLAELTLDPPASTGDLAGSPFLDEEYVILSTIHSAKGCEWDVVYLIHAADGVLPSDMSDGEAEIEEERRLLYVALTRARDRLYVTFPLRYYHRKHALGDSYSTAQLCRFLHPGVLPLFERTSFKPPQPQAPSVGGLGADLPNSVRDRVRKLWD
jgi:DNA helicase II / ATP-dependent DNA helicase PcrA